ncbi:transposase, partial [Carboxydocella sp. JDF658]
SRLKAQALLDSQTELLKLENEETEEKLGRARKKLSLAMRKLAKAEEKGAASEVIEKLRLAVKGRNK